MYEWCSILALYKVYYQSICNKNYDALFFNFLPPFVLIFFVLTEINWKLAYEVKNPTYHLNGGKAEVDWVSMFMRSLMSPGPPAPLENDVGDPVEGTEKRTELASRLDTITLRDFLCEQNL